MNSRTAFVAISFAIALFGSGFFVGRYSAPVPIPEDIVRASIVASQGMMEEQAKKEQKANEIMRNTPFQEPKQPPMSLGKSQ